MSRKALLVDFDGTIAQFDGEWKGLEWLGEPIARARHAMLLLARDYRLVCFTTRPAELVEPWLSRWGFPKMKVSNLKEPAHLLVDDRVLQFQGEWTDELLEQIREFKPHWQKS